MCQKFFLIFISFLFFYSCKQTENKKLLDVDNFIKYEEILNKEDYLDSLYNKTIQAINDSLTRDQLLKIAARYDWLESDIKFHKTINHIYYLAINKKDTSHQAQSFWYLGDFYDSRQNRDSAYFNYLKAEKLYASQKDSIKWARMLSYKAGILYNTGIYTESETATIQSLQILSNKNETRLFYEANLLMTLILKDLKDYKAAEKYYEIIPTLLNQQEREGYDKYQLQRSRLSYYNNIGGYYNEISKPSEAKKHFESALSNKSVDNYPKLKAMLLNNYAYSQILLNGDMSLIDSLINSSLEIRKKINHNQGIADSKMLKAQFNLLKNDTVNAILTMREAYEMALEDKSGYELLESLKFLSEHDNLNKDLFTSIYIQTQDSLQNIDRQTRNKFARISYETNEIEKKNDILIKRNYYLIGIISIVLILSLSIFIILKLRLKNKKLLHLQHEQKAIQQIQDLLSKQQLIASETRNQERIRIAKDLHDAIVNRVFTTRINLEELPSTNPLQKIKLIDQLKQTETQIRTLAHDIHNNLFDQKEDFKEILKELVLSQKNSFKTAFECPNDISIDWSLFSIKQKTQVYLILQELLQNVNKHSQATRCFVLFIKDGNKITVRIHDNGIGVNEERVLKGMGINNIKHRLKELNGEIIFSKIHEWTVVSISFITPF